MWVLPGISLATALLASQCYTLLYSTTLWIRVQYIMDITSRECTQRWRERSLSRCVATSPKQSSIVWFDCNYRPVHDVYKVWLNEPIIKFLKMIFHHLQSADTYMRLFSVNSGDLMILRIYYIHPKIWFLDDFQVCVSTQNATISIVPFLQIV